MFNCSDEIVGYHNDGVTLPQSAQNEMRDRRDANRKRLKEGLKRAGRPAPNEFKSQGSYAMKTMTRHPENDYDIDDGVYFEKGDLVGPRGGEMTALEARQMVRDALDDGSFKTSPEVHKNCVRVLYDAGYHVDVPIYRRVVGKGIFGTEQTYHELASTEWKRSDARDVTTWFEDENDRQSPDMSNGRQLRRITRDIKKFGKSRSSWVDQILSGFGITKLVTECYRTDSDREDRALYNTMKAVRDRLNLNLVIKHPVTPGDTITKDPQDSKAKFLCERLSDALTWLDPLFESDCNSDTAMKCWDKVFNTTYFTGSLKKFEAAQSASGGPVSSTILTAGLLKEAGDKAAARAAVRKEGGGRYA